MMRKSHNSWRENEREEDEEAEKRGENAFNYLALTRVLYLWPF